ncbi:hypothetical protein BGZ47_006452, partial [Haplosporangium gracile]
MKSNIILTLTVVLGLMVVSGTAAPVAVAPAGIPGYPAEAGVPIRNSPPTTNGVPIRNSPNREAGVPI